VKYLCFLVTGRAERDAIGRDISAVRHEMSVGDVMRIELFDRFFAARREPTPSSSKAIAPKHRVAKLFSHSFLVLFGHGRADARARGLRHLPTRESSHANRHRSTIGVDAACAPRVTWKIRTPYKAVFVTAHRDHA
jgi:hypothetical protein